MKGRRGLRSLGKHPEGRGVLDGKYEVEVGSQNEMFTEMRKGAQLGREEGDKRGSSPPLEVRELRVGRR